MDLSACTKVCECARALLGSRLSGKTFSGLLGNHTRLWGRRLQGQRARARPLATITLPNQHAIALKLTPTHTLCRCQINHGAEMSAD